MCLPCTGLSVLAAARSVSFTAIKYTTVTTAVMLMNTSPAIVVILSAIIFREPFTRRKFQSLLLTFVGVSLACTML